MAERDFQVFLDELLSRTDIVSLINRYVPLIKKGNNHVACCPFHVEKPPSFSVNASLTEQLLHRQRVEKTSSFSGNASWPRAASECGRIEKAPSFSVNASLTEQLLHRQRVEKTSSFSGNASWPRAASECGRIEKAPSFSVNASKRLFCRFGRAEGANSISFIMKRRHLKPKTAELKTLIGGAREAA